MFRSTVILCAIASQVLAAPKPDGCMDACNTYREQQTHEAMIQHQTAALNELQQVAARQMKGMEFSRPGNWTEQNEYRTDGGRGRVYEEHGQMVSGPRRVQYYKKNYSSSSHGVNTGASGLEGGFGGIPSTLNTQRLSSALDSQRLSSSLDSQRLSSALDSQRLSSSQDSQRLNGAISAGHRSSYDEQRLEEVRQSSNRLNSQSGRLEDFAEPIDDTQQVLRQVPNVAAGRTWHRADSWRTEGGRGVVHEEEGQVVNGPSRVKYYRQNYSSSYSSGDTSPVAPSLNQPRVENEMQRLHSQLDSFGREIHRSTVGQRNLDQSGGFVDEQVLDTTNTRPVLTYGSTHEQRQASIVHETAPTPERYNRVRDQTYQEVENSASDYSATNSRSQQRRDRTQIPQRLYVVPAKPLETVRQTETHQVYQESVAPQSQIIVNSANEHSVDRDRNRLLRVPVHTDSNVRSVVSNDEIQRNRVINTHEQFQSAEEMRRAQIRRDNVDRENLYADRNVEAVDSFGQQPAAVNHYEEKWSEGYRRHSSVPQQVGSSQYVVGQHASYVKTGQTVGQMGSYVATDSHSSRNNRHESASHFPEGFRTQPDRLVIDSMNLGKIGQTGADCDQGVSTSEQFQYGSMHHRKFKREADPGAYGRRNYDTNRHSQQVEDLTQQTTGFDDFYRQHYGHLEDGQESQKTEDFSQQHQQQTEDLTQQTGGFDDFKQQTSGNLEFGQQHEQQTGKLEFGQETQQPEDLSQQTMENLEFGQQHQQQTEDLTQQTGGFDDFTQQTSGKLEFGQEHEQQTGKLEFGHETQQTEDLSQQTTGYLEFGQQHQQQTDDLSQQTGGFGDFSQQTSDNLEFGEQHDKEDTGKLNLGQETQQTEDLTQQTEDLTRQTEDLTQQTTANDHNTQQTDFTQQTGGFDDFTQQTSGKLEFGQQNRQDKHEVDQNTQQTEYLTQQVEGLDDFSQQTSGNLEFGQHHQHGKDKFDQESQQTEDLTQQTSGKLEFGQQHQNDEHEFDQHTQQNEDFTQQTSGKLEFGQQHDKDEFDQHTQQNDDFTQQTSGKLEFRQQHQHDEHEFDQHTQQSEDFTQQTSGKLEFGQQHRDKDEFDQHTQHTEDFTQQTSGKLEFGQQHHGKDEFDQHTQQNDDFTQQNRGLDDYTQQTSGKLEFGHQHQHGKDKFDEDSQQTEDLTQQASEKFEFVQQGKHRFDQNAQETEDLSQHTGGFDDFTQQTSGHLEFGQQRQYSRDKINHNTQQTEDLTQQTEGFGNYNQQTSGNLEFGQQHQRDNHGLDQNTQQTEGFGNFNHQTSGKLEIGNQRQHGNHGFDRNTQQTEDLTQQTGGFGDFTQQSSSNIDFGQDQQQTDVFDLNEQTTTVKPERKYQPGVKGGRRRKPAPKPTLRPGRRYDTHPEADLDTKSEEVPTVLDIDEPETHQSQNQATSQMTNRRDQWQRNNYPSDLANTDNHQIINHQVVHEEHTSQTVQRYQKPYEQNLGNVGTRQSREYSGGSEIESDYKVEPRIIEAYGGAGAYDVGHNDEFFAAAKPNPSATLPPKLEGVDPWDVREKPAVAINHPRFYARPTVETTTQLPEEPTTTPSTSFWGRIGHKITNTYEKAKEKATSIFGK